MRLFPHYGPYYLHIFKTVHMQKTGLVSCLSAYNMILLYAERMRTI